MILQALIKRQVEGKTPFFLRLWEDKQRHSLLYGECLKELETTWWETYWSTLHVDAWPVAAHYHGTYESSIMWQLVHLTNRHIVLHTESITGDSQTLVLFGHELEDGGMIHRVAIKQAYCILSNNTYLDGSDVVSSEVNDELEEQKKVWIQALQSSLWAHDTEYDDSSTITLTAHYDDIYPVPNAYAMCQMLSDLL